MASPRPASRPDREANLRLPVTITHTGRRNGLTLADLVNTLSRAAGSAPSSLPLQSRLCYLRLLSGDETGAGHQFVASQAARISGDPYLQLVTALDRHRHGDIAGSLQLLVPLPHHRWHQGEAAVIASLIASAGEFERSAPLIHQIDPGLLFPEERAMIEPWRTRIALEGVVRDSLATTTP